MAKDFYLYVHPNEDVFEALKGLAYITRFLYDVMKNHIDTTDGSNFTLSQYGVEGLATLLLSVEEGLHEIADRPTCCHDQQTEGTP